MTERKFPTEPGLWLRKEPTMLLAGVNVEAFVSVYDGPRLPLAWYSERSQTWEEPCDDGFWIREIREDDVPAAEVERAVAAERAKIVQFLRMQSEGCEAASSAQFHDNSNIPRYRIASEVLAAVADAIEDGEVP